jgi:hypothetical protein
MDDDNLFDEDDALDYVMYEECEKDAQQDMKKTGGKGGCLGMLAVFVFTPAVTGLLVWRWI